MKRAWLLALLHEGRGIGGNGRGKLHQFCANTAQIVFLMLFAIGSSVPTIFFFVGLGSLTDV
jgi:hypothetical protein